MLGTARQHGTLALAFIDLERAYDRIRWLTLWRILADKLHIPSDIYMGIEVLYYQTKQCVHTGGQTSAPFKVNVGVKQAVLLAPACSPSFSIGFMTLSPAMPPLDIASMHLTVPC